MGTRRVSALAERILATKTEKQIPKYVPELSLASVIKHYRGVLRQRPLKIFCTFIVRLKEKILVHFKSKATLGLCKIFQVNNVVLFTHHRCTKQIYKSNLLPHMHVDARRHSTLHIQ